MLPSLQKTKQKCTPQSEIELEHDQRTPFFLFRVDALFVLGIVLFFLTFRLHFHVPHLYFSMPGLRKKTSVRRWMALGEALAEGTAARNYRPTLPS